MKGIYSSHRDAIIIIARVAKFKVINVMIDNATIANMLFNLVYERMALKLLKKLKPSPQVIWVQW